MEPRDRERVSRVLEAALASLNEEAHRNERPSNLVEVTGVRLVSSDSQISGAPVVILIHPNSNEREVIPNAPATQIDKANSCGCSHDGSQPHPELEHFPLSESDPRDPSEMCFIEPDQVCVGSGACEMRGY